MDCPIAKKYVWGPNKAYQMKGEIMSEETRCLRCGGTNLRPSSVQSTGKVYACPKGAKLSTLVTTGALIDALTCLDCGHVELLVDVEKVRSLVTTG